MSTKNKSKKKHAKKNKAPSPPPSSMSGTDSHVGVENLVSLDTGAPEHDHVLQASVKDCGLKQSCDLHQTQNELEDHQLNLATEETTITGSSHRELAVGHSDSTCSASKKSKKRKAKKAASDTKSSSSQIHPPTIEAKSFTFEEQVEWCIGQLELGLLRRDASKSQKESNEKNIKTLKSLKVAVPRKRQLMRSLFGNYRSKMMASPPSEVSGKSSSKQPCVSVVEREVAEHCGRFFKCKHSEVLKVTNEDDSPKDGQKPFQFDFVIDS